MSPDEFEKAVDRLMDLIEADGCSAVLTEQTVSIDLHGDQVTKLVDCMEMLHGFLDAAVDRRLAEEAIPLANEVWEIEEDG